MYIREVPWEFGPCNILVPPYFDEIRLLLFKLDFLSFINLTYPIGNQPIRKSNLESGRNPTGNFDVKLFQNSGRSRIE